MTEKAIWYALDRLPGVGRRTLEGLLDDFGGAEAVLSASEDELLGSRARIPASTASRIGRLDIDEARRALAALAQTGIEVLTWLEDGYPANLALAPDRPAILMARGSFAAVDTMAAAIVGSTQPSDVGRELAHRLGAELASRGVTVVSGLARGIDTAAHCGAVEAGGRSLAVLGSGLGRIFPPENRELAERIAASGALVSEQPIGTGASGPTLMARNRITSGLAKATIVVECHPDSGTLETATKATRQGRLLYVVDNGMKGNSALLADGARPIPADRSADYGALAQEIGDSEPRIPERTDGQLSFDFG